MKNNVEIINLEKTAEGLARAKEFVADIAKAGKHILFAGGKSEAHKIVTDAAISIGMPYAAARWVGGTLTNFGQIKKRIAHLEDLLAKKEKGALDIYTKKERLVIDREIEDLKESFGGLVGMKEMPAALFVVDSDRESIAVTEARKMGVPVISLSSSDCDISKIDYPIVANDAARSSIEFFVNEIAEAFRRARAAGSGDKAEREPAPAA